MPIDTVSIRAFGFQAHFPCSTVISLTRCMLACLRLYSTLQLSSLGNEWRMPAPGALKLLLMLYGVSMSLAFIPKRVQGSIYVRGRQAVIFAVVVLLLNCCEVVHKQLVTAARHCAVYCPVQIRAMDIAVPAEAMQGAIGAN
jgi:ABC-type transport system involved in cytochrome c biogenesis permease subunit